MSDSSTPSAFRWFPLPRGHTKPSAAKLASLVVIVDPLEGTVTEIRRFPHSLESKSSGGLVSGVEIILDETGSPAIAPLRADTDPIVNGAPLRETVPLPDNETVTLQFGDQLAFLRLNAPAGWPEGFDAKNWSVFDSASSAVLGQGPTTALLDIIRQAGAAPSECAACPAGLDTGFVVAQIAPLLRPSTASPAADTTLPDEGPHFCPACWKHFHTGDTLSIATHEDLLGDPVLGPDHRLRFQPTRFADNGIALDALGEPSPDLACPHCRRRLPHGYLENDHRVISLVGAPGSGKSYFLAALTRMLRDGLHRDFGLALRDDDPTGNMLLNQMSNRLFSALTPADAILGKTAFEGAFYERVQHAGRAVSLPRPFVYSICGRTKSDTSIILYDNAGEHFEPGIDQENSPGALHIARSAGLFFLFDPTSNSIFRTELEGKADDPQLKQSGRIDQQDTLLQEMDVRVKRTLGLRREDRIDTPLAVLIGKCDVWTPIFDATRLPTVLDSRRLNLAKIDANSDYLRSLLLDLCPSLVSGAEAISTEVRYFAVSALGHSPSSVTEGPKAGTLAPDPKKLKPYGIETAAYWLIARAFPDSLPTV